MQDRFTERQLQQFQEDGYVVVRGMVGESIWQRILQVAIDDLGREVQPIEYEAELNYPGAPSAMTDTGGRTARRLKAALSRNAIFMEWIVSRGVRGRLEQLLDPPVVMPLSHHNCLMTKQPRFSSDTGWHQDVRYWSFSQPDLVSLWLALGPEYRRNGCLRVIPGSHRGSYQPEQFDSEQFLIPDLEANTKLIDNAVDVELDPGDVLFFHARLFHAATRNFTEEPKFSAVFTFRSFNNSPLPQTRSSSLPELLLTAPEPPKN
ncbi:phytanoyl-CoA dioxygenase family protein [Stratiformator vulcanicus]|uniref:Phytanoyl-CoA dioxygenase (PhyH) n=1 Tax=Stratiformator vulcanicus TaxID=2527980 RepID=A0A517R4A2_9PLAN|nr:phytanoyl-CoA dioxygenase family protein [Stratiformator vulcanicus]QDT38708.1 Phytanoyl-CoA dioxygenase (PhyH) [Stratiformator vulcanicus]